MRKLNIANSNKRAVSEILGLGHVNLLFQPAFLRAMFSAELTINAYYFVTLFIILDGSHAAKSSKTIVSIQWVFILWQPSWPILILGDIKQKIRIYML